MKKEPWDSSDDKAKELRISDFGTSEEVRKMAKMPRFPKTYKEVREILFKFVGQSFDSRTGLNATLSKNSIEKILSDVGNKGSLKHHLIAAGNLDKLFSNAIEPWSFALNPNKNNDSVENIHRLFAPMDYEGNITIVKITVKEMKNPNDTNRIYTIKALKVYLK